MNNKLFPFSHPLAKAWGLLLATVLFTQCNAAMSPFLGGPLSNSPTSSGNQRTPLHIAAERGDKVQVQTLLQQGADINALDEQGNTPLHLATLNRHSGVVKLLIQNSAAINAKDAEGRTPLLLAVGMHGDQAVINTLLQRSDIDLEAKDKLGYTSLYLAASRGLTEAFRALLNKGANINAQSNIAQLNPLHGACFNGYNMEIVGCLLQRGAHINAQDHQGQTPLHILVGPGHVAAEQQPTRMLQLLLDQGARVDVNKQDHQGQTPLHIAAATDCIKMLETLLEKGARLDIDKPDHQGQTPLHIAASKYDGCDLEMIEMLLKHKADINIQDKKGNTPLHYISSSLISSCTYVNEINIVEAVLKSGAQPNIQNKEGDTPLHYAIQHKCPNAIESLLKNGAQLDICNHQGLSPLDLMDQEDYSKTEKSQFAKANSINPAEEQETDESEESAINKRHKKE